MIRPTKGQNVLGVRVTISFCWTVIMGRIIRTYPVGLLIRTRGRHHQRVGISIYFVGKIRFVHLS